MKKIKLFLMVLLAALFMFSCTTEDDDNNKSSNSGTGEKVAPGTIEETPASVTTVISALEQVAPAADEAVLFYYRPDGNYNGWDLWLWPDGGDGVAHGYADNSGFHTVTAGTSTVAYMKFNASGTSDNDCVAVSSALASAVSKSEKLNFIVRKGGSTWEAKDPGSDQSWDLSMCKYFAVISGNSNVYAVDANAKPQIVGAAMTSSLEMKLTLSCKYAIKAADSDNGFSIESTSGDKISINKMRNWTYRTSDSESYLKNYNYTTTFWVQLGGAMDLQKTWKISHSKFAPASGMEIGMNEVYSVTAAETEAANAQLGSIYTAAKTTFKVWAPLASDVNLLLYDDWLNAKTDGEKKNFILTDDEAAAASTANGGIRHQMTKGASDGVWSTEVTGDLKGKYYTYEIVNGGNTNRICDIYAKAAASDSVAAQIIDMSNTYESSYTNPFGNSGAETKDYTDAVIFEMHIRDWSRAYVSDSTGKFEDITNAVENSREFAAHLRDLGVTHVQILPMFDYAEKNDDANYNWGYNPYQYNVPEGRYVKNHDADGRNAVLQMQKMIAAFHNAGIAVNLDVVYNHTSGTGIGSLLDMTVPYYYYRLANGVYSNGSGCGNETASNHTMFKKFMIESLKHWMNDYHINGFRFDLMGLHEISTMKEIYTELKKIDQNVMVYGEPWTGGSSEVKNGITSDSKNKIDEMEGVAMFNDNYRNAIKGAEFGGFQKGFVQGVFADNDKRDLNDLVLKGLVGSKELTTVPGRSINYVECHDNYTLFDKLAMSYLNKTEWEETDNLIDDLKAMTGGMDAVKAQNKMAAALVFLAQGTPFINGGQEFMRTKNGNENSYCSSDEINEISLQAFMNENHDVYSTYKGLIALRKDNSAAFGKNGNASAKSTTAGQITYTTGDFCVLFNALDTPWTSISTTEYSKVIDVSTGSPTESTTLPTEVPAKSFVILKK